MSERDNTDVWAAVAIGAIVGIGATLLMRAQDDDDVHGIVKKLRPVKKSASRAARVVGKELGRRSRQVRRDGGELASELLEEMRDGARGIVRATRNELRKAAEESVREARRAAIRAARRKFS